VHTVKSEFAHVASPVTRRALEADPATLDPKLIRVLAHDALIHVEVDLFDPEVLNAGERMEVAEAAVEADDPVRAHALVQRFWGM
jgi:hypothetical protein